LKPNFWGNYQAPWQKTRAAISKKPKQNLKAGRKLLKMAEK
jgi:hypothetical protein